MDGFVNEPPNVVCSHFLACHRVWYDNTNPDAGWSLAGVIVHIRPSEGQDYPFRFPRLFLYTQLHGTPGEYTARARYLRIGIDDDGEELEDELGWHGPWDIAIPGENYVECFGFPVVGILLPRDGVYEFQLWIDGFEEPLARERIEARE